MAKLSSIEKNKRRTKLALSYNKRRTTLKDVIYNKELSFEERFHATVKLSEFPRNSSKIRIRNRCELTGRSRGVYRKFKLSRICIRNLASLGLIPGLVKASW
jgi:small subunit ribosomal protein S14